MYEPLLSLKYSPSTSRGGKKVPDIRVKIENLVPDVRNKGLSRPVDCTSVFWLVPDVRARELPFPCLFSFKYSVKSAPQITYPTVMVKCKCNSFHCGHTCHILLFNLAKMYFQP